MVTLVTSHRFAQRRALQAAKAAVAVLGIVTLSYVAVTSVEHSLALRDAAQSVSHASAQPPAPGIPCANFPDMTCPSRFDDAAAPEPVAPTF